MQLHNLTTSKGMRKRRRKGRGNGSQKGTYCGRGCKGLGQRKSGNVRPGFEGGQTPLIRRIPKLKGFKSFSKIHYQVVNLKDLAELKADSEVTMDCLVENNIVKKKDIPVKILSMGEVKNKLNIAKDIKLSKMAREKIEKTGGVVEV